MDEHPAQSSTLKVEQEPGLLTVCVPVFSGNVSACHASLKAVAVLQVGDAWRFRARPAGFVLVMVGVAEGHEEGKSRGWRAQ